MPFDANGITIKRIKLKSMHMMLGMLPVTKNIGLLPSSPRDLSLFALTISINPLDKSMLSTSMHFSVQDYNCRGLQTKPVSNGDMSITWNHLQEQLWESAYFPANH
jgi:hypothetical protein